jgi:hypothetical protein
MDPIANLRAQRALVTEANAIQDRWSNGSPPASVARRLQEIAIELAQLVEALDGWRTAGGFDPYAPAPDPVALASTRERVQFAFDCGNLDPTYCVAPAQHDGQHVLIFGEDSAGELEVIAEIIPPRNGYTSIDLLED